MVDSMGGGVVRGSRWRGKEQPAGVVLGGRGEQAEVDEGVLGCWGSSVSSGRARPAGHEVVLRWRLPPGGQRGAAAGKDSAGIEEAARGRR